MLRKIAYNEEIKMIRKNEDIRIVRTKKSLKTAFISLLERIPYSKISIIDICNEAKVHRATFYNYYRSKEDLFSCIIEDSKDSFVQKMKEEITTERRSVVINYLIDAFIDRTNLTGESIYKILNVQDQNVIAQILNRSIYQMIYQVLSLFPNGTQVTPKDFICSFYSGAFTNIALWYARNPDISKEEFSKYIHNYLKDRDIDDYS